MPFSEIINIILPTFVTIVVGYAIGKTLKIEISGIVDVVFYVGLPALAFVSILNQQIVLIDAAKVWAAAMIVMFGCGAIGWLVFKLKREKHSGLYLPISLPNTVNVPFPIISLAYGPAGLFTATLYYIPNVILLYSLGVFVASGKGWKENFKAVLKVPAIYGAVLGLLFNLFDVSVPSFIVQPLDFISGMVIPAILFTLGYSLASIKVTSLPTTFLASFIRVGGGLALGFIVIYLFGITGIDRSVVILMSAMPAAVNTYLLAAKYKNEAELVASVVLVTTVASLLIVPFLLNVLG